MMCMWMPSESFGYLYDCSYSFSASAILKLTQNELKVGMGVGEGRTGFESIFSTKVQRPSCFRNTLWPSNLVGRTPNGSVMHCLGQRSCRGQAGVKLLRNALWSPNFV